MLDFYLEGKLPQATYEAKQEQIAKQRQELEATAEKDRVIEEKDVHKVADLIKAKIAKISQSTHNFVKKQNQDDLYKAIYDFIK